MNDWIMGNKPQDMSLWYWITVKKLMNNETYPMPCKYNTESDCWVDMETNRISAHTVVAYYPIIKPKPYTTIGTGCGYYIRANYKNDKTDTIYGFGLQPANWCNKGYNTLDKAKSAIKRLKKIDEDEGNERDQYEVLDGESNVVWKLESR